ncbi:MAG: PHP domain-containing protein, partial [Acidobacteriota bacterium]|nr:PHP domain-containing protein [Acidobacteriota bacterium]
RTHSGIAVDLRVARPPQLGNLLQHFTGSGEHNAALREQAVRRGLHVSEYGILDDSTGETRTCASEREVYELLGLAYIEPELREDRGELQAARLAGDGPTLPRLVELADMRGDMHLHTIASDGHNTIGEMAEAAHACGYKYIAITDHTKSMAMTGGMDEKRALDQIRRVREVDRQMEGRIRVFTGIEVDILADGALDLDDEVLAQMDVVIAAVHTRFEMNREQMTARVLRAIENPYVRILGHPTGRLLLRREPFALDMGAVLRRAAELGVAVEHNAAPERLDLCDRDLRLAKETGCLITINSDSHDRRNLGKMGYGVRQLRRAWLEPEDVLNTRGPKDFLAGLRPRP